MHRTMPLNILAVDDEPLLLYALERACKGRTLEITTAVTTDQALAKVEGCNYDLFLLDFDLHDQSRLDLLRAIDQRCPYVPVILMTTTDKGSTQLNDAIRAIRRQGAWHLLEKPFSLDLMIRYIDNIFKDKVELKTSMSPRTYNDDHEKRSHLRHPRVEPVKFSYQRIVAGERRQVSGKGIFTDISESGSGLLSHEQLPPGQILCFENSSPKKYGMVAWSTMMDTETCRFGVQFCSPPRSAHPAPSHSFAFTPAADV